MITHYVCTSVVGVEKLSCPVEWAANFFRVFVEWAGKIFSVKIISLSPWSHKKCPVPYVAGHATKGYDLPDAR